MARISWIGSLAVLLISGGPIFGQPASPELSQFQARTKEFGGALQSVPQAEASAPLQRDSEIDFIIGNMLFVLLHETAHNIITEFGIPVLGPQEDAADVFAVLTLLKGGSPISQRVLVQAARGWFLSNRRAKRDGDAPVYYDEHGLDEQRAYHIICLMVGSNPARFAELANEALLPQDRQRTCQKDYSDASAGWDAALKPHRRAPEQPKTKIEVVYGEGKGPLDLHAQGFRSIQILEVLREYITEEFGLPTPFTLEMQSCGVINALWNPKTNKLTLCYELAADFGELYHVRGVKLLEALETMQIGDQPGYVPAAEAERLPATYQRQLVFYRTPAAPGTIIVNTDERFLYVVQGKNRALRYGIGVGRNGFQPSGMLKVTRKVEWPDWTASPAALARQPDLARFMVGGPGNPLGARVLYLGDAVCRIQGTNQPQTIGQAVPSGCFRLVNSDVIDLYDHTPVGTKVVVRQAPET
jgi:lipoprotein-anchoring transpeptidase ErfK/SrfK